MSNAPQLGVLGCPACGGALDGAASGVFRCRFCDAASTRLDGAQLRVAARKLPTKWAPAAALEKLQRDVDALGISPRPSLEAREVTLTYLARAGRVVARGRERRGIFGVPVPERPTTDLLFVDDPAVLEAVHSPIPDDLANELVHFSLRVKQAAGELSDASWEPEVLWIALPALEVSFSAPELPQRWGRVWRDTRPDGRYRVVIDLWRGAKVASEAPRLGIRASTVFWAVVAVTTAVLIVVTCPGLIGGLVAGAAGVLGVVVGLVVGLVSAV